MNIVVLDGYTINPGDLSWEALEALGACTIYDRTRRDETLERAREADILFTNKTALDREIIEQLPRLKYVGVLATGTNVVDGAAARERGIPVTNVPAYGTATVAQAVFALLLELTNRVGHHDSTVREGRWSRSPDFCYFDYPQIELAGLTFGILGYGAIGRATARIARGFGMNVIVCTRTPVPEEDVRHVTLDELFRQSDVVSLHCPLTPETRDLVNAERLALMKPTAFLINTSRGALIREADLAWALNEERIAGAGLDVLAVEPPLPANPLPGAKNCIITPHIAWAGRRARERCLAIAVDNLRAHLAGQEQNVVNR